MSDYPSDLKYTNDHEWVRATGTKCRVGITEFAAKQLGDVVFVELPEVGRRLDKGEAFGTIESVKAVSEIYAPVSGKIVAINDKLSADPEVINTEPYGDGWLVDIEAESTSELGGLKSSAEYADYIKSESE